MANSLNKIQLIGRIGKEPEIRATQGGKAVTTLTLATGEKFKQPDGSYKEDTQWHRVILWEKTAQFVNNYAQKGSRIYVEGVLKYREYTDKDGNKRNITEITGQNVILLEGKKAVNSTPEEKQFHGAQSNTIPDDDGDDTVPF